jgi:hypothetical protein
MLSRSDMRQFAQAARNNWPTPVEKRREAVTQVRDVINSDAAPHLVETAMSTLAVLKQNGWVEDAEAANVLK